MSEVSSALSSPVALQRGKVKFFAVEKRIGYLSSEQKKNREIFFRARNFSGPVERERGQLCLDLAKRLPHPLDFRVPTRGDELVYLMIWTDKGPVARNWCFASDWEKARRRVYGRLSPDSIMVRVKQSYPEQGLVHPGVLWEGELGAFLRKLDHGFAAKFNETAIFEECRATGWVRVDLPSIWSGAGIC